MAVIAMVHRLVMGDVNEGRVLVNLRRSVRARAVIIRLGMMLDGIAARVARMRPDNGDQAGDNGAQQRQENDRLNHVGISPSSD